MVSLSACVETRSPVFFLVVILLCCDWVGGILKVPAGLVACRVMGQGWLLSECFVTELGLCSRVAVRLGRRWRLGRPVAGPRSWSTASFAWVAGGIDAWDMAVGMHLMGSGGRGGGS